MATSVRKKSVVSSVNYDIPLPTQTNTLLNKSASSSSSLYQQCSQLRARLNRIHSFYVFLEHAAAGQSVAPVDHLWDCFALGTPLCFLFNLLPPPATPIDINTDPSEVPIDPSDVRAAKKAIIEFIMAVKRMQSSGAWEQSELFQVTELTDRNNMDGFVKVVSTVTNLVDRLPPDVFTPEELATPPTYSSVTGSFSSLDIDSISGSTTLNSRDQGRRNIILELINTERKYVGDLEVMQKYATALLQRSVIDQDTILELFPGLNKLLDFQRRFLIRLEQVYELPWPDQRWGKAFIDCEAEFEVYAPYCANYDNAVDVLLREEQHLMELATLIHPKSDLPAFLIKPVQRICKYPLLLESLLKACTAGDYPYFEELVEGAASTKRVTLRCNEAQRRAENRQIMKALEARVEDWKGHHIINFGDLVLQDFFSVTKSDVDRDYHVFLFEKIILCCKEDPRAVMQGNKKVSKSNSILKKQGNGMPPSTPFPAGSTASARKGTTPLLLKGRIFLNNVIDAMPIGKGGSHDLRVSWRGDDDTEHFTLRCKNEEQLRLWETQITRLIVSSHSRRRGASTGVQMVVANSTNPAALRMQQGVSYQAPPSSYNSVYGSRVSRTSSPYGGEDRFSRSQQQPKDGFDIEDDYDDDLLPTSVYPQSGRGTPMGSRRMGSAQSMPPERDIPPGYDRPRARTEDHSGQIMQQWRINGHAMPPPPPPPIGGLPNTPATVSGRPYAGRMSSNSSMASSETSSSGGTQRTSQLRSQYSTTRLRSTYEAEEPEVIARTSSAANVRTQQSSQYPQSRSRSASIPSAYAWPQSAQVPPPLPSAYPSRGQAGTPLDERGMKRDSGSSSSTRESSDYSPPHSTSPITPYGSTDSTLASSTLRSSRSQVFKPTMMHSNSGSLKMSSPPVKVKVHFGDDLFVIIVSRTTDYNDLVEKVGKKIRLCGGRRDSTPLRVKYQDEDGDMVSLGSNEDVQMAFDTSRSINGGQVTLFVM